MLSSGAFAGIAVTFVKKLRQNNNTVTIYLYFSIVGLLVTFPVFIVNPILPNTSLETLACIGIILASLAAQLLMTQGFLYCKAWEGSLILSSELIFTALVGIMFFNDKISLKFIIGGLLILWSVIFLIFSNKGTTNIRAKIHPKESN
jgi:drug/metabolite transporter (DMT)-like permease